MDLKLKHVPWCDSCHKPLEIKIHGEWAQWYCPTVSCKEAGAQVRIHKSRLNGTVAAVKAREYL